MTSVEGVRLPDERGSATVIMLAVISAVLVLTVSGLLLASAVLASHRARTAADLAALAAVSVLMRGGSSEVACLSASQVAVANHAEIQLCTTEGMAANLSVSVLSSVKGLGVATARSRAGPAPT